MPMLMSRDPFARTELHRQRVYDALDTCDWCGGRNVTQHNQPFLFEYYQETDSGRRIPLRGKFCNSDCFRSYHP